jgi:hypothetical protein
MHANPYLNLESETALGRLTEARHLARDLKPRRGRPAGVVLMGDGIAEHRQQAIALRRSDMAFVTLHDFRYPLAITSDHQPIALRLDPRGELGGVHQIGEHDCQPPDLTTRIARDEQIVGEQSLGLGVRAVDGQHLAREGGGTRTITAVDRRHRPIQQFVDPGAAIATIAAILHIHIVSLLARDCLPYRRGIPLVRMAWRLPRIIEGRSPQVTGHILGTAGRKPSESQRITIDVFSQLLAGSTSRPGSVQQFNPDKG